MSSEQLLYDINDLESVKKCLGKIIDAWNSFKESDDYGFGCYQIGTMENGKINIMRPFTLKRCQQKNI